MNDYPRQSGFTKIEKVVEKVLVQNQRQDLLYFTRIYRHWNVIVGEQLGKKTSPEKLKKGVLTILVSDSAYSHSLKYYERNIIDLIASPEICGENVVRKVAFHVGIRRHEIELAPEKTPQIEEDPVVFKKRLDQAYASPISQKISDKPLRKAFSRCMTRINKRRMGMSTSPAEHTDKKLSE